MIDVPAAGDETDIQPRAYSIASTPEEDEILFVIKYEEGGRASEWIKNVVTEGTEARIQGPLGVFTLDQESKSDLFFICTSTGNAPFYSMIRSALASGDQRQMYLLYGCRSEEDLYWQEELSALADQHENFHMHFALSQPSETWEGLTGRVQTLIPDLVPSFEDTKFYVCGNPEMTKEVKTMLMEEYGVEKKNVHIEGYI